MPESPKKKHGKDGDNSEKSKKSFVLNENDNQEFKEPLVFLNIDGKRANNRYKLTPKTKLTPKKGIALFTNNKIPLPKDISYEYKVDWDSYVLKISVLQNYLGKWDSSRLDDLKLLKLEYIKNTNITEEQRKLHNFYISELIKLLDIKNYEDFKKEAVHEKTEDMFNELIKNAWDSQLTQPNTIANTTNSSVASSLNDKQNNSNIHLEIDLNACHSSQLMDSKDFLNKELMGSNNINSKDLLSSFSSVNPYTTNIKDLNDPENSLKNHLLKASEMDSFVARGEAGGKKKIGFCTTL